MATKVPAISLSDALGLGRLAADGAVGITGLVEDMHKRILGTPGLAPIAQVVTGGVTRLVYQGVRGAFQLTGKGFGSAAALVGDTPDDRPVSRGREVALAVLNGVVGDHLAESGNPLALKMRFRRDGRALALERQALAEAFPGATGKLAVMLHGLCMSDLQWERQNHDHGAALARDLGYTPVTSPIIPACTSRPTAALSPKRWRRWSPHGRSTSRILSSSATAWAGLSRAAPAAAPKRPGMDGERSSVRSSFWARRTTARRSSGSAIGSTSSLAGRLTPAPSHAWENPQRRRHRSPLRRPSR